MRLSICSERDSWLNAYIPRLVDAWSKDGHTVAWLHDAGRLDAGDLCFFLGYGRIVGPQILARHSHNLVVHESDLPRGRGWSPLTWQVLEGASAITVSLFEAVEEVDAGPIYLQCTIELGGKELIGDLRRMQAEATVVLCSRFVAGYPEILAAARPQTGGATYYERRRPADSELDADRSIREQFNRLRVADNERYPAFVNLDGARYRILIERDGEE